MKPSDHFANLLRGESRHCQNVNAAALLQEVAAWLDGGTIFNGERRVDVELWEHADRLCGGNPNVTVKTCEYCGGQIVSIREPVGNVGPKPATELSAMSVTGITPEASSMATSFMFEVISSAGAPGSQTTQWY
jgi:hypothetical protein